MKMATRKYVIALIVFISLFSFGELFAQGSLWVQTLSYDSITVRRGTWKFPDNPQDYRKILMHYSLKCDPRTTQDKYNCGEWDYLTYNMVYQHTGVYDSTQNTTQLYKVGGRMTNDTFYLVNKAYSNIYKKKYINSKYLSSSNLTEFPTGAADKELTLGSAGRIQFLLTKEELAQIGLKAGDIIRMKLPVTSISGIDEIAIKMKKGFQKNITKFDESGFTEIYRGPISKIENGSLSVDFKEPFNWSGTTSLVFEISYTLTDNNGTLTFKGFDGNGSVIAESNEKFLDFDGNGDWVDCGNYPQLDETRKFTLEGWINIRQWRNWANVLGKGDNTTIQLGNASGDLYCIVRGPGNNSYGYSKGAIPEKAWTHIAMVFDGTKATNEEKLILYVNGEKVTLTFNGTMPLATYPVENSFSLSNVTHGTAEINASLDEARLWGTALDGAVIKDWMNKPLTNSHPEYANLKLYYPLDAISNFTVKNEAGSGNDGVLVGTPIIGFMKGDGLTRNIRTDIFNPSVTLINGNFVPGYDTTELYKVVPVSPVSVEEFEIINYKPVRKSIRYAWLAGYSYTYDENGKAIDSTLRNSTETLFNQKIKYYGKPFEKLVEYEIGRYITPYGINLDLGPEGFTWQYDVTDYAPLLKGNVDFSAGNQQELIDVKFEFIPGEAPRDVVGIQQLWGPMRSYSYKDLSADNVLSAIDLPLNENTKTCKIITRLTGHGHNSNDGKYPHCCEWKDNVHSLVSGKGEVASWHIFQYDDCAMNPVFPQGGTWPGSREGWCPGDVVKDNEFELTNHMDKGTLSLDYDITKVPDNNQGMGGGNYVVCMHLIEYSDIKHNNDVEICEVITPNINPYFSRKNPICADPTVVVRNNGKDPLTKITFEYGITGGQQETYTWTGNIASMGRDTLVLPIPSTKFWLGDAKSTFNIKASKPNGKDDENTTNDSYSTYFELPDLYKDEIYIVCKSNNRVQGFSYYVSDWEGNKVVNRPSFTPNTVYKEKINFGKGCYTLVFTDDYNYGLSYWAYTDQGSGYLRIEDASGKVLKTFNPDFGHGVTYSFDLGGILKVQEPNEDEQIMVYPNPTFDYINFETGYLEGDVRVTITDITGKSVLTKGTSVSPNSTLKIDISALSAGNYFVTVKNKDRTINKRFMKK